MVFSSLIFLFAYLPLTLACYFLAPRRWKNAVLLVFSLLFYGWSEPIYLFLMLASISSAYGFGFLIQRNRDQNPRRARLWMWLSVGVSLSFLFFFKYYNFFAENLSRLPLLTLPVIPGLRLPIGISFYTFQIISYTVDLWRGNCRLQRNYVSFGAYVTLFPQLVAGPIVRYSDVDHDLTARRETLTDFSEGALRFSLGLSKKVLLGDPLAAAYLYCRSMATLTPTTLGAWMVALCFTLHLYYDFSGYSDMAIGLGRMLGFHFPENFNYPYIARSITEFWRRWHISLSTWFREYIYIPLGGNRRGRGRTYLNLAVVWILTGLWHGADWNFVLWGAYFCLILILEKAFLLRVLEKAPRLLQHLYAFLLVTVGFVIFSHADLSELWARLLQMIGMGGVVPTDGRILYRLRTILPLLLIALVGATPIPKRIWQSCRARFSLAETLAPIFSLALLLVSTAYLVDSTYSPFAYTQF